MKYEIYYLEPLIAECLSKKTVSAAYVSTTIEELRINLMEVKTKYLLYTCNANSNAEIKRFFKIHQTVLTGILNNLASALKADAGKKPVSTLRTSILKHIHAHCTILLDFISETFPEFSNWNVPYPDPESSKWKSQVVLRLSAIGKTEPTSEIITQFLEIFQKIIGDENYKMCRQNTKKWSVLMDHIESDSELQNRNYEDIACLLIRHGFNARKAHDLLCTHIDMQLQLLTEPSQQRALLCYLEKIFEQASLMATRRFFQGLPKLCSSLLRHIRAEIKLLELLKDAGYNQVGNDPFLGSFTVSLSVKQLAFFVFLQVETGVLLTRTAKQVHQYFASRFSTIEGGTISEKSFKNAYYSHSPEDILRVIDKLSQMLVIAEQSY